jgi:hypothetical protein
MAATTQSTQYAAEVAAAANYSAVTLEERGTIRFARFDVPTTTDNAPNDVIALGTLPEGAVVLPELSRIIVFDDMSSGAVTIDIGDVTDVDRYADGVDCAAVGIKEFLTPAIPDGFTNPYKVTGANCVINAKLITFAATVEAGGFSVILAYRVL